jgi:hypothetical protein
MRRMQRQFAAGLPLAGSIDEARGKLPADYKLMNATFDRILINDCRR